MLRKTLKYRMYPTAAQQTALQHALDACRWVYNKTLEVRKQAWEERQESVSLYDTQKMLTTWKVNHSWLAEQAFSQCLQQAQVRRVDLAFQAFFRRVKTGEEPGYPRFKGRGYYDSFTFTQLGFQLKGGRLRLSKIGAVRLALHRDLEGTIKTLTIRRTSTGKWYACFSVAYAPEVLPPSEQVTGIDVGLEHFATLSNGQHIANPRFLRRDEHDLRRASRKLSQQPKGTHTRNAARRVVQHIHERIANRRLNFCHQEARKLVNTCGVLAIEDLAIRRMVKLATLAKSISDVAWGTFFAVLHDKAASAGRTVVTVDPRHTSQMCSRCGQHVQKTLATRQHCCPSCGLSMHRDHNAAMNILRLGLQSLPSG